MAIAIETSRFEEVVAEYGSDLLSPDLIRKLQEPAVPAQPIDFRKEAARLTTRRPWASTHMLYSTIQPETGLLLAMAGLTDERFKDWRGEINEDRLPKLRAEVSYYSDQSIPGMTLSWHNPNFDHESRVTLDNINSLEIYPGQQDQLVIATLHDGITFKLDDSPRGRRTRLITAFGLDPDMGDHRAVLLNELFQDLSLHG